MGSFIEQFKFVELETEHMSKLVRKTGTHGPKVNLARSV